MNILGTESPVTKVVNYQAFDITYSRLAILLKDTVNILSKSPINIDIPVPLIGFYVRPVGELEILKYEWSTYPYVSRQVLTNGNIKKEVRFSVELLDPLNQENPLWLALIKRQLLTFLMDKYCTNGGRFTILTLWGTMDNCVLENFVGINAEEGTQGTSYRLDFVKPNFTVGGLLSRLSGAMSSLQGGGVPI